MSEEQKTIRPLSVFEAKNLSAPPQTAEAEVVSSPVTRRVLVAQLDFFTALRHLYDGRLHRIRRAGWADQSCYCQLRSGVLQIFLNDQWHNWIVSEADMAPHDWLVE